MGLFSLLFCGAFSQVVDSTVTEVVSDSSLIAFGDSTLADTIPPLDPVKVYRDSVMEVYRKKSDLQSKVEATAQDSSFLDVVNNVLHLYGDAVASYEDFKLEAHYIMVNFKDQTIFAYGKSMPDGSYTSAPKFTQKGDTYESDSIKYNFKSEKALVYGGRTSQGEFDIVPEFTKRMPDGTLNAARVKFTTCDADHPHYYIEASKVKIIPNQRVISGPLRFVVADFPLPFALPFGFFPATPKAERRSGILSPRPGDFGDRGFGLQNLGYYQIINDNFDFTLNSDIYTRGSWALSGKLAYNKRYKYSGNISVQRWSTRVGERDRRTGFTDPNFSISRGWNIGWTHNQPINPTTSLNANVNIQDATFIREFTLDPNQGLQNQLNSSASFTKRFAPFNLTVSANHTQDVNQRRMTLRMPNASLRMNRQQPFKSVKGKSLEWLKNFGVDYQMDLRNELSNVPDSIFLDVLLNRSGSTSVVLDPENPNQVTVLDHRSYWRNGLKQRSSMSTAFKIARYMNISTNFTYNEYSYLESLQRVWNRDANETEDLTVNGFASARDFNFSVNANTTIFALFQFLGKKQTTIRQQLIPTIGYSLNPDWSLEQYGFYNTVQRSRDPNDTIRYSRFANGIYGGPGQGESQSMTFGLSSVVEMKYKTNEALEPDFPEGKEAFKYTRIIDNIGLSGSYNFAADSFQLSTIRANLNSRIFNGKVNLVAGGTFDPYALELSGPDDSIGRRVNKLLFNETKQLARLTSANFALTTSFAFGKGKSRTKLKGRNDEEEKIVEEIRRNYDDYVDFNVPLTLNVGYNLAYSRRDARKGEFSTHVFRVGGSIALTDKWNVQFNTGYDVGNGEVTVTNFSVNRNLHCWNLSFNATPFGTYRNFTVALTANSSLLSFLRLTKQNRPTGRGIF
ncbi:MAG: putative LPS assembly protein LptD [Bacteroidia bacterium]